MIDFSFVIPVYKTEDLLPRCIESIESSFVGTNFSYEIIVVDDGNVPPITEEFLKQYQNIKLIKHECNKSCFQARISGFRVAVGNWVLTVDPDDMLLLMDWNEIQQSLQKHNADIFMFAHKVGFCPNLRNYIERLRFPAKKDQLVLKGTSLYDFYNTNSSSWYLTGKVFSLGLIKKFLMNMDEINKGYYLNMSEDYCIASCLLFTCKSLLISTTGGLYYYYLSESSETRDEWTTSPMKIRQKLQCYDLSKAIVFEYVNAMDLPDDRKITLQSVALKTFNTIPKLLMPELIYGVAKDFSILKDLSATFQYASMLDAFSQLNPGYEIYSSAQKILTKEEFYQLLPEYPKKNALRKFISKCFPRTSFIGKILRELNLIFK